MNTRTRLQIAITLAASGGALWFGARHQAHGHAQHWMTFGLLLVVVLLSSTYKVSLPRADSSMSLDYPFILLGIVQLSPLQAMLIAAFSVAAQCRMRVPRFFTLVQLIFNIANTILATGSAYLAYALLHRAGMAMPPALAIASIAYFFVTTFAVALILSATTADENPFSLWRREFVWYLPFYLVGACLASLASWISLRFGWTTALLMIPLVYTLYRAYTTQSGRLKERQQHLDETEALHMRTIEGLAMAIEAKDQGTHDHLFRVRHYVKAVGTALKLSNVELRALETAAFLHDIGKLAVPEHIINKPGKLTPEEFEKMKIHPVVGADLLERVRFPYPVVPIVRSHHERWDGAGYPDGLAGENIPIGARILTVVDCFDALASDRPYRRGLSPQKAMEMLRDLSGKQFDPEIVNIFENVHAALEAGAETMVPVAFIPLNTEVQVARGEAPGAGFQVAAADSAVPGLTLAASEASAADLTEGEVLQALTAANQTAQVLFELSQTLGDGVTTQEMVALIALRLEPHIPFATCALYLKNGDSLERPFVHGECAKQFMEVPFALGDGLSGWVAQSGLSSLNGNASMEPGAPVLADGSYPLRSALSIPLTDLHGNVFAALTLYSMSLDPFSKLHLRLLTSIAPKLSLAIQNTLQARSQDGGALDTDFLTGLPNARKLFLQFDRDLADCVETKDPLHVVVCDLNGFRDVNERRGQIAGDRLLRTLAGCFRQFCAGSDLVARVGRDEFTFLFFGLDEPAVLNHVAAIRSSIEVASRRCGHGTRVSASIGYAAFPADGDHSELLLAAANRRMYLEKERRYSQTTPSIGSNAASSPIRSLPCAL